MLLERVPVRAAHLAGPLLRGLMAPADAILVAIVADLRVVFSHLHLGDGEAHELPLPPLTFVETGWAEGIVHVEVCAVGEAVVRHNGGCFRWREGGVCLVGFE